MRSALQCPLPYDQLFDIDARKVLPENSSFIDSCNFTKKYMSELKDRGSMDLDSIYNISTKPCDLLNAEDIYHTTAVHLHLLFGLPVYRVNTLFSKINTTHECTPHSKTAIHYHIKFNSPDKDILTFEERYHDATISFWVFPDRVVFQTEDGIDSW
jgi:hypothetical protein